jgi:hypothetical protein
MYTTTNPDVFNLKAVDQVADASLRYAHALGKLLRRL